MSRSSLGPAVQIALAVLLCGAPRVQKASPPAEPAYVAAPAATPGDTISGWVVDANDWLDMGFIGARHRQSALTNADLGTPLVILTDRGSVVYPVTLTEPSSAVANNVRLIPFAEERVTVTGRVIQRGKEQGIVIAAVEKAPGIESIASLPAPETATTQLVGWVTDLSCWLVRGETGAVYVKGARGCAEDGEPLVLVADSGEMYYPVVHAADTEPPDFTTLIKYVEHKVRVIGRVITRGTARAIVIDKVATYDTGKAPEKLLPRK